MDYRTSVLNDFSAVSKAFFQIYHDEGIPTMNPGDNMLNRQFKYKKEFPVQINPNTLRLDYYATSKQQRRDAEVPLPAAGCIAVPMVETDRRFDAGHVDITLDYNIFDEYNARTMYGYVPGTGISLHSDGKGITSLEELRRYAGREGYYAMFIWGEIHVFGLFEKLNVTYNAFSRWGEPLRASAEVTIDRQPLGYDSDGIELDPLSLTCSSLLGRGKVEAEEVTLKEKAKILATDALRMLN